MAVSSLVDQYGRPINLPDLKREQAAPTTTGVRQPTNFGTAGNLTPWRLARLLRESVDGLPERYLELAEHMEETNEHYAAVLGVRKRQVSGLDITVEAASDDPVDQKAADLVRDVINRDGFEDELFDMLDAIGKGFSATEIIWEQSASQWMPAALKWRDPRWFRFDREDGETLLVRDIEGDQPLKPSDGSCIAPRSNPA